MLESRGAILLRRVRRILEPSFDPSGSKLPAILIVLAVLVAVVLFGTNFLPVNRTARAQVSAILLQDLPPRSQLRMLEPYVRLGENIAAVHGRIASSRDEQREIERPTLTGYGLDGTSLMLAVRPGGKIIGIGRHNHGTDDGTIWLAEPNW